METQNNSRRAFLQKFLSAGLVITAGAAVITSCNSGSTKNEQTSKDATPKVDPESTSASTGSGAEDFKCDDFSNVSKEELDKRKKLGYEEQSSDPERECIKCNLFIPKGKEKACGGCILFKGPVNNAGTCTYWAEQVI